MFTRPTLNRNCERDFLLKLSIFEIVQIFGSLSSIFTNFNDSSQSFLQRSSLDTCALKLASAHLLKYLPETPSTSFDVARNTDVFAPSSTDMNMSLLMTNKPGLSKKLTLRQMPVSMRPLGSLVEKKRDV